MTADFAPPPPRLAELLGALSLATDSANGVPPETALRTAVVAAGLARVVGLDAAAVRAAYLTGLLRFLGCTAYAHETAARYAAGDDVAVMRAVMTADAGSAPDLFRSVARGLAGASWPRRAAALARLSTDAEPVVALTGAHCRLATVLAARLGVGDDVVRALGELYERWDGRGSPHGLAHEAISPTARLVMVAVRVVSHDALEGRAAALDVVRERSGHELDPQLATALLAHAPPILGALVANDGPSVWDEFLAAEPQPWTRLPSHDATPLAEVFADYADLKSPFTLGHSRGVATLASEVAAAMDLPLAERTTLHAAALVHDLGRVAVANGIWDKPAPLTAIERERAESHARHTALVLARTPLFAAIADVAGQAHERSDGSGYPRRGGSSDVPRAARILAACDVFHALSEDRPHRPALAPEAAIALVAEEARAGRLDRQVVDALLSRAAGQPSAPRLLPDGLSEREVEVLCLLARGLSNKEIGARLGISAKTVQHHVAHIYGKTAIRTRAAAAIYAVDKRLLTP